MTGQIITVRHGRPALSRQVYLSASEFGEWWKKYDEGGLLPGQSPPESLVKLAAGATIIYASSMPRSIETAQLIAPQNIVVKPDPVFVEAPLPHPPWPSWIKLSPRYWGVISRTYWNLGYIIGDMETRQEAWIRVDKIIEELREAAQEGDVVVCAHGYLNWMIDRRSRSRGLKRVDRNRGNKYWSYRCYDSV